MWLTGVLGRRLSVSELAWLENAVEDIVARGSEPDVLSRYLALASRHMPRAPLAPSQFECQQADEVLRGWNPERWSLLDTVRVGLVLALDPRQPVSATNAIEECFRYADVGELVALYRSLALLPSPERFAWRAGEGCRSSMRAVFEAVACDSPLAFSLFDDVAWRQMVIKALFVEAPLWRVFGLDRRLDSELARMALDLCDERRSAGRPVRHELWLVLGRFGGERGRAALERELDVADVTSRRAAAIGLARASELDTLRRRRASEHDPLVLAAMDAALAGRTNSESFCDLDPTSSNPRQQI